MGGDHRKGKATQQPLWYHLNVGIFDKEVREISGKIKNNYYDIVLFEDIPFLNNFYPDSLRNDLRIYYPKTGDLFAPRKLEDSVIEVYIKKRVNYLTSFNLIPINSSRATIELE